MPCLNLFLPTSVLCPSQELREMRLSITGRHQILLVTHYHSTQDLSHKHRAPVPLGYKTHTSGEHRRELKEDRLGHCASRTWGRSLTGNLSVWTRSLWSWEENTFKIQSGPAWEVGQDANTSSTRKNQQLLLSALPHSREVTGGVCRKAKAKQQELNKILLQEDFFQQDQILL